MSSAASAEVVDFIAVLDDLRRHGLSTRAIGKHAGVSHVAVLGYRDGAMPGHPVGERLVTLWCGLTNKKREELPRVRQFPSASKAASW